MTSWTWAAAALAPCLSFCPKTQGVSYLRHARRRHDDEGAVAAADHLRLAAEQRQRSGVVLAREHEQRHRITVDAIERVGDPPFPVEAFPHTDELGAAVRRRGRQRDVHPVVMAKMGLA